MVFLTGISLFAIYNFPTRFEGYASFSELILSSIKFGIFLSIIISIIFYNIIKSEKEDLKIFAVFN